METKQNKPEPIGKRPPTRKRRAFALMLWLLGMTGVVYAFIAVRDAQQESNVPIPLRAVLKQNDKIGVELRKQMRLTPTYPRGMAVKRARVNGDYGVGGSPDRASYKCYISKTDDEDSATTLTFADFATLPHTEIVYDFKCIEGWSQITWWGGAKFADFVKTHNLGSKTGQPVKTGFEPWAYKYVGMASLDGGYYVGIDLPSALHPQTTLAYELNGKPLPDNQGAPLRLIIPVKYGVKSIKQIGSMYFTDTPPPDYWAELGYDYDLSL